MAEAAIEMIGAACVKRISYYSRVEEQREYLIREMTMLKAFQRDVEEKHDSSKRMNNFLKNVTDIIYRIEDVLADFDSPPRLMPPSPRDITVEIRNKVEYLIRIHRTFGFSDVSTTSSENQIAAREIFGDQTVEHFVGRADEMDILRSYIHQCRVVSIYGMAGLGKTALAQKLYQHHLLDHHQFDAVAWVYVSHKFSRRKVLEDLYEQLNPNHDSSSSKMRDAELIDRVREIQQNLRCLVFLDDVCSREDWDTIRDAFPSGETPSKILITTRVRSVAEFVQMKASGKRYVHKLRCLTEDEGCQLFRKMVRLTDVPDFEANEILVQMAKETVNLCEGSPVAIIGFLQFMATKNTLEEWMIVHRRLESFIRKSHEFRGTLQLLSSSYYNLPHQLRSCFLYLGHFQEHSRIESEKLYLLWEAEGLIDDRREQTLREVAEGYLVDLADRSMVEVHEDEMSVSTRFKSFQLSKLMRDLCLLKNKELGFFKVVDFERGPQLVPDSLSSLSRNEAYRLAINLDKYEDGYDFPLEDNEKEHIRSLLFSTKENHQGLVWPRKLHRLSDFRYLRILDFNGFDFQVTNLPQGIGKLVHLRYLSFRGCILPELPSSIGNLTCLIILDLRVRPLSKITIPDVMWKLKKLKHLYFPLSFLTRYARKLRLKGLVELETLINFNPGMMNVNDLSQLLKLQYMSLNIGGSVEDIACVTKRMNMDSHGQRLRTCIKISNFDCYTEEKHSVIRSLLASQSLIIFSLEGHFRRLPVFDDISQNIARIELIGSELIDNPMRTLEKLPNLRVLVLNDDAFIGKEMVCSAAGFVELKHLELLNLQKLEKWTVEEGAMPKLSTLAIQSCGKLIMLTEELQFVGRLRQMIVSRVHEELKANLGEVHVLMNESTSKVQNARPNISIDDVDLEHDKTNCWYNSENDAIFVLFVFADNGGVIVNPKGEMKDSAITGPIGKKCTDLWPRIASAANAIV
ncbi:hypothetical protein BUALT_Bualt14G0056600 [Buddleja alternifolia]|uniref:NB-ARC domain-containing protein n=1 Tax=Buddleja alternifolia TaxID=168488 RepID=A0AAV6WF79_9LAMI|nr:hypothetical protein BUALT_Bualt14G0056600 [Buddleja alternifolia]